MMEYANESVIKALRQYNFLSRSLSLISDVEQKRDISIQMTKITENIINITNKIYEDRYNIVANRKTYLMDDEKNRLQELINLINERKTYINNQISNNRDITGLSFEVGSILGEDKIDDYKNQLRIIDKYKSNIKLDGVLKEDISKLDISIEKAKAKISGNKLLNKQLELRMIKLLDNAFSKLNLYELQDRKKEIDLAYTELGYSLEEAKKNANKARKNFSEDIVRECDNLLAASTLEYERYKEKKFILKLIEIYKVPCSDYESVLSKREEINSILSSIVNSELYNLVGQELNKEYATIKLESQDKQTLDSLLEERENKKKTIVEINKENDSEEFKSILANLLENEKKHQEELMAEKRRLEEIERQRKIEEEKKRQEEMVKRQRLIEEERKKEIERRTKQLLDAKKNTVLNVERTSSENDNKVREDIKPANRSISRSNNLRSREINNIDNNNSSRMVRHEDMFNSNESNISSNVSNISSNVRSSNYNTKMIDKKRIKPNEDIFVMPKLKKEEDIFPSLPDKDDSFFDENEFEDLNKYVDDKKWF